MLGIETKPVPAGRQIAFSVLTSLKPSEHVELAEVLCEPQEHLLGAALRSWDWRVKRKWKCFLCSESLMYERVPHAPLHRARL